MTVVSSRVVAIRPEPNLERALQTPTREAVQQEADRAKEAARADGVRTVGLATAGAEAARLAAYREMPAEVLHAIALERLAANPPQIGELTITPDVVTKLLGRYAS